jgi:hypothetical protein
MSGATAEMDRSPENDPANGIELGVYVVREVNGQYLFSEFSAKRRLKIEQDKEAWLKTQEQAEIGRRVTVRVEAKRPWGCICREVDGLLEGVILAPSMADENGKSTSELGLSESQWERLSPGLQFNAVIARKEFAHWRYAVYLGDAVEV